MVLKHGKTIWLIGLMLVLPIVIQSVDDVADDVATELIPRKDFEQLRSERMATIYQRVQDQVLKAESDFSELIKMKLQSMGSYSEQGAEGFNEFLVQAVRSFIGSMHVVEQNANSDYYFFLEGHGLQTEDPRDVSPDERVLFQGVHRVTQLAISYVRALVLDLTSKNIKSQIGFQVAQAFEELEIQDQRDYQQQLAENEKGFDRSWWQSVRESGLDLLGDFSEQFKIQVKQEVHRQVGEAIDQAAGAVLGAVAQGAIGLFKPLVGSAAAQLSQLSDTLAQGDPLALLYDHTNIALKVLKMTIRFSNPVPKPTHTVSVQTHIGLGQEELTFLKNRSVRVQKVLKSEFGIAQPLRMSWCFSGGGIRAALMTEAMLAAAARHKILDVSMYLVGLSGSTWFVAPWSYLYLKGYLSKNLETSIGQVLQSLEGSLNNDSMIFIPKTNAYGPPMLTSDVAPSFSRDVAMRFAFNQTITIVDMYGALIGDFTLKQAGKKRLNMTWSSMSQEAQSGIIPWPLCSSVFDPLQNKSLKGRQHSEYEWFEMSPSQAGSSVLGYIPIQYFGSSFKDGKLVVDVINPEYPLSFYLGVYGSAFAALSPNLIIDKTLPDVGFTIQGIDVKIPVSKWVRNAIDDNFGKTARSARAGVIHAQFPNYSSGVLSSILQNEQTLGLVDGATDFNFPLPLLFERSERRPDIVFLCDSADVDQPDLQGAKAYFKRKGITAVPDLTRISKTDLQASAMTVFNDPRDAKAYDSRVSTIIYFPTRGIDLSVGSPYFTLNFKYTPAQIKTLVDNVSTAFESQVPEIKKIMKLVAQRRYGGVLQDAPEQISYFKKLSSFGSGLKDRLPVLGR